MKYDLVDTTNETTVIKVIGVGGGGCNAVEHMCGLEMNDVEYICMNTDVQVLQRMSAKTLIQIGSDVTRGQGAGADPEVGRQAAIEDRERIVEVLSDCDMVFVTCGMGGGTGTGAAPIIAEVARERGILTVAVVTKPFSFEGSKRMRLAEAGIRALRENVDSVITIHNDKLMPVLGETTSMVEAFAAADDVLYNAVRGISELITRPGLINVDFADVRTVMATRGMAMMGTGRGTGEDRAKIATEFAISCPLLEDVNMDGARGVLVNVIAGRDLHISEYNHVCEEIHKLASDDATTVMGQAIDDEMSGELRVTIIATGLDQESEEKTELRPVTVLESETRPETPEQEWTEPAPRKAALAAGHDLQEPDFLNIPTFLRNQAD